MINIDKIKSLAVLGLGKSGISALKLASRLGLPARGFDEKKIPAPKECGADLSAEIWNGQTFSGFDIIITSPGIPERSEMMKVAIASGAQICGELEFASLFCKAPIVAITGTNGKTTTTELTCHLLKAAGKNSVCAGNIGTPLSEYAAIPKDLDFIVAEVSSFQLDRNSVFSPAVAAVLNIESDHMDRYSGIAGYARTKFGIFRNIGSPSNAIVRHDLLGYWSEFTGRGDSPVTFSLTDSCANIHMRGPAMAVLSRGKKDGLAFDLSSAKLRGAHNMENIMSALALVFSAVPGASAKVLEKAACEFRGAEHRIELVAEKGGIRYVNDSKATNPDSVRAALRAEGGKRNVCLIAGGLDKNMDFSPVMEEINRVKAVFLVGECKNKLFDLFNNIVECILCDTFNDAVCAACEDAKPGDVVMLSPGCASMDMFKDYKERGNIFKETIKRRLEI